MNLYDSGLAGIYDQLYAAAGKDYAAEAVAVTDLIRHRKPGAASLLDVACGTGEHLRYLRDEFVHVEGVEVSESMRALAIAKLAPITIHAGDMRSFALPRSFDAVVCLFSSIGYVLTTDDLRAAVGRMATHLTPGGVLVVEPWFFPTQYHDGTIGHLVAEQDGRTVVRMSHSRRDGRLSLMDMHYLVGDSSGVRSWTETHQMGLFTIDEYRDAFARAGLDAVELLPGWRPGRDRLVAVKVGRVPR